MPARSRHCNGRVASKDTTGRMVPGRFEAAMIQSQENCLTNNHRYTCERQEGDFVRRFYIVRLTIPGQSYFILCKIYLRNDALLLLQKGFLYGLKRKGGRERSKED